MDKIISVSNLKKSYGNLQAVKGIDFYVERGKLFAFLGPNGAGKSTTIDIICTLLKHDEGEVIVDGHKLSKDDNAIRSSIGVVFQDSLLDPLLTVKENLKIRAGFYKMNKSQIIEAINNATKATDISEFINRPYGKLSGGQRRRADIARALLNTPKVLFLDEPTTGLDPQTRKSVWQTIQRLQKENGITVFLTTHYMEEAANADYVIVIDNGIISAKGTPYELKEEYSSDKLCVKSHDNDALSSFLDEQSIKYKIKAGMFIFKLAKTKDSIEIIKKIETHIESFEVAMATMDDVFLAITGNEVRDNA